MFAYYRQSFLWFRVIFVLVGQLCLTLCHPMDSTPPGSSAHGILQARILEWVAVPFSRGSSQPKDRAESLTSPTLAGGLFTTGATWEALRLPQGVNLRGSQGGLALLRR